MTLEITARVPGRCQCCRTPYPAGARLRQESTSAGPKWVLVVHGGAK